MDKGEFLHNLRQVLQYHKELGIQYPDSDELQKFLCYEPDSKIEELHQPETPTLQQQNRSVVEPPSELEESADSANESVGLKILKDVKQEDELCAGCQLKAKKLDFIIGKGGENIKLMVVGDWLTSSARGDSTSTVFGAEQDLMLARMFNKMQLPEENIFITNVVKCALPDGIKPEKHDISRCVKYLYYQIEKLRPEIICVMGTAATRMLLKKSQSLSQLRGRFYQVEISKELSVPVLATYHPTYLLKNKEMRWPAWEDLQKVSKRLGIKI